MDSIEETKKNRQCEERELLDIFASMHLMCIKDPETPNEKMSLYLLEKWGYINAARARLGGEFAESSITPDQMEELRRYYEQAKAGGEENELL